MSYFTKKEAYAAAARRTGQRSARKMLTESMESYSSADRYDVFLSHSFSDADLVLGVKTLLEAQGMKVYVDWIDDDDLDRNQVTIKTAETLRFRMRQSHMLYFIATKNTPSSKWMPWELGFFDGFKPNKVFILPVMDSENEQFEGQEYLKLYPIVSKEETNP